MKKNKKYRWGMKLATLALSSSVLFSTIDTASAATYTVKSGDSLSKIANQYGVSYQTLMKWNNLSSTTIRVGQKLNLNTTSTSTVKPKPITTQPTAKPKPTTNVVQIAKQHIGVRYKFGGSKPSTGFDCSGYVTYVLNHAGISTARKSAAGFYSTAKKVSSPQVGDLVFFANTYKAGISHVGFYIGNNQMISASDGGVSVASINSTYWKKHFAGYGRL